jgi:hypothetical protein
LWVQDNEVGGKRYWSDEIGGGVVVWDTCLVSGEMVRLALKAEREEAKVNRAWFYTSWFWFIIAIGMFIAYGLQTARCL